jgi:hypothetical protein
MGIHYIPEDIYSEKETNAWEIKQIPCVDTGMIEWK